MRISNRVSLVASGALSVYLTHASDCNAYLVHGEKSCFLIDTGTGLDQETVIRAIEEELTAPLRYILITHHHADHIGGMKAVLNRFPVKQVYDSGQNYKTKMYNDFRLQIEKEQIPFEVLRGGQEVPVNEMVKLKVLSPQTLYKGTPSDTNNNSLVLRLEYKDFAMLLTGDIQAEVERDLLQTDPEALQAQVLKVAHHGSKTSSINEFLAAVKPKIAVISSGEGNKYKHPSPEVVQRLYNLQADVFNTALCGDIIIKSNGKTCDITVEKFYDEQQAQAA